MRSTKQTSSLSFLSFLFVVGGSVGLAACSAGADSTPIFVTPDAGSNVGTPSDAGITGAGGVTISPPPAGTGGAPAPGAGGTATIGVGGTRMSGTGGVTVAGTGGVTVAGTGGKSAPGTGGVTVTGTGGTSAPGTGGAPGLPAAGINYVFVIAMENESAAAIYGNSSAPYINGQLLPKYARASAFVDPLSDGIPSEPHYVWMEAGTNKFSDTTFTGDGDPSSGNSTKSTAHLVTQMGAASPPVSWLSYQEGLNSSTGACPVRSSGFYAAKHDPFIFFQDVAGSPPSASNTACADHHRSYDALAQDLTQMKVARYNFISPNVCHDMHGDSGCPGSDDIATGDAWLAGMMPALISFVNANGGVIFLVWDEPEGGSNLIPFVAIGPGVKANYAGAVKYDHGSLTKTIEEIFRLPILPTVAGVNDFGDLFRAGILQ